MGNNMVRKINEMKFIKGVIGIYIVSGLLLLTIFFFSFDIYLRITLPISMHFALPIIKLLLIIGTFISIIRLAQNSKSRARGYDYYRVWNIDHFPYTFYFSLVIHSTQKI